MNIFPMKKPQLHYEIRELWNDLKYDIEKEGFDVFKYTIPQHNMSSFDSLNTCLDKS
jgi:hypothetical protein